VIYIHIGTEKTGTTSIQHFYYKYQKKIKLFHYPIFDNMSLVRSLAKKIFLSTLKSNHLFNYFHYEVCNSISNRRSKLNNDMIAFKLIILNLLKKFNEKK